MTSSADKTTTEQAIADNVRQTLDTAIQVLGHFEGSLTQAGFAEGAAAYRKLADTLIGQRLWSTNRGIALDQRFAEVARRARSIHDVLAPYVNTMLRLGAISQAGTGTDMSARAQPAVPASSDEKAEKRPDLPPSPNQQTTPASPNAAVGLHDRVIALLGTARRPMSLVAMISALRCDKSKLLREMSDLERAGQVKRLPGPRALFALPKTMSVGNR